METALGFLTTRPASGARIFAGAYGAGARQAADARVSRIVQGIIGNVVGANVGPHVVLAPKRERRNLDDAETVVPTGDLRSCARR